MRNITMRKIQYNLKVTNASTDYVSLDIDDNNFITSSVMGIICYMDELSICTINDVRMFNQWYNKSDKRYLYNKKSKRYNSPRSMLSGMLNSYMFGNQYDYSLPQLVVVIDIINVCVDIIEEIKNTYDITLQEVPVFEKIFVCENLWVSQ